MTRDSYTHIALTWTAECIVTATRCLKGKPKRGLIRWTKNWNSVTCERCRNSWLDFVRAMPNDPEARAFNEWLKREHTPHTVEGPSRRQKEQTLAIDALAVDNEWVRGPYDVAPPELPRWALLDRFIGPTNMTGNVRHFWRKVNDEDYAVNALVRREEREWLLDDLRRIFALSLFVQLRVRP